MIPLQTDRPLRHSPWVNSALIGFSVGVFVVTRLGPAEWLETVERYGMLFPPREETSQWHYIHQFLTYQFLHADWKHLLGNMLFLWVFGNAVEDRFGHIGYAVFYLAGGIIAGIGHSLAAPNPVLGASGAVAAVTGAFFALFPKTKVRLLWLLFIITIVEIPSMWFIGFAIARDFFFQILPGDKSVAYVAHLAGYGYGLVVGLILLWTHILSREPYDLFTLIKHWNRRRQFRSITKKGFDPWSGRRPGRSDAFVNDRESSDKAHGAADDETEKQESRNSEESPRESTPAERGRHRIHEALRRGDTTEAARETRALWETSPDAVLGESDLLAVSNQFFAESDFNTAARGYRMLLDSYPTGDPRGQVRLMLAVTLARYLDKPDEARPVIASALERLPGGSDREFALEIQREIGTGDESDGDSSSSDSPDSESDSGSDSEPEESPPRSE